jgi:hypothetical protein
LGAWNGVESFFLEMWKAKTLAGGFLLGGDRGNAAELGRLKGEADALEQVSIKKNCGIQFRQG